MYKYKARFLHSMSNKLHSVKGPAIINEKGQTFYFVNGVPCYNAQQYATAAKLSAKQVANIVKKYGKISCNYYNFNKVV